MSNATVTNATLTADLNTDDEDQTATLVVGGLVVILAIITVILRCYTRISTKVGLWWDDFLIVFAVLVTITTAAILIWGKQRSFRSLKESSKTRRERDRFRIG